MCGINALCATVLHYAVLQAKRRAESLARADAAKHAEIDAFSSPEAVAARREAEVAHSISQAQHAAFVQASHEQKQLEKQMGGIEKWLRSAAIRGKPLCYLESVSSAVLNEILDQVTQHEYMYEQQSDRPPCPEPERSSSLQPDLPPDGSPDLLEQEEEERAKGKVVVEVEEVEVTHSSPASLARFSARVQARSRNEYPCVRPSPSLASCAPSVTQLPHVPAPPLQSQQDYYDQPTHQSRVYYDMYKRPARGFYRG